MRRILFAIAALACWLTIGVGSAAAETAYICDGTWMSNPGACVVAATSKPTFKGWGVVLDCNLLKGTKVACPSTITAWKYASGKWTQTSRKTFTRVYVWPYAGAASWRWTWTQTTGWLAMPASKLAVEIAMRTSNTCLQCT